MRYLVIPAYEPDEKLLKLLRDLQSYKSLTILVVNDGSASSYNPIFEAASQFSTVLCHKQNYGKGRALKTAFSYITNIKNTLGEGIVITADSDGQHTPLDIFKVGKACEDNPNTLITGERYFTGNVPFRSRFGNTITKYVFSFSTGLSLKDTQCGLRAFSTELLPFLCSIKGERYEYEMNVLLEGAKKIPIKGIPIETVYIDGNRSSHFHPLKDAIKIYKEIFKFAMSSMIGFCVDYIGYALLIFLLAPIPPEVRLIIANVIARLCSATVNYCLNKKFVFKDNQSVFTTGSKYALLACSILVLNTCIILLLNQLGIGNLYFAKLVAELLLFLLSWSIQKHFIFLKQHSNQS
ncbi:MAG: bifunctional glycosyltransferase family 2/GtrA family protein [Clostridiales bacterium]|nr:bifunctional glycosyltransferase family 2/GtrA family protein [Clostridiales bacterium]